ncbi:MAG: transglutaminase domain-containing protein, partial [candidate division WOR-3 bacterium]|nr:transglutaminase domain-containing protein [candidate division WOR-3 bacterium]
MRRNSNIEITQNIILVGEQAKFILKLKNDGASAASPSVRYQWDTQIADNDGAPLREEGGDLREFEIGFEPVAFNYWSAYAHPEPGSLVIYASWDNTPNKIVFAHWPEAYDSLWDYSWSLSRRFYTPGYVTSPESDSCVLMYWKDISLSPGEEKSIVAYYGTTVGGGVNVDVSTEKSCYASSEDVTISAKVTDAGGNPLYPLDEENFKVFVGGNEVGIEEFERISCTDYRLKIKAPQEYGSYSINVRADTATGWGSDIVEIKVYNVTNVSLAIGGNRLTQYENSADTPVYYRADSDLYPEFEIGVELNGATLTEAKDDIQVSVNISDYTGVKSPVSKRGVYRSDISKYRAEWKDSTKEHPVGKYNAIAEIKDSNGNLLASSEKKHFYLIFKPSAGYEGYVQGQAGPCSSAGWWSLKLWFNPRYNQFNYQLWKPVLDKIITGETNVEDAAKKLLLFAHGIDGSYYGYWHMMMDERKSYEEQYGYPDPTHQHGGYMCGDKSLSGDYDACLSWLPVDCAEWRCPGINQEGKTAWWKNMIDFIESDFDPEGKATHKRPTGVCDDYATLFVSNARSAGIPARELRGNRKVRHEWARIWNGDRWIHADPTWYQVKSLYDGIRIMYDTPDVYVNERGFDTTGLPEPYRYSVSTTIEFDSENYDYGDVINANIIVKNNGHIDIKRPLHLKFLDKPTIARLGPSHLLTDIYVAGPSDFLSVGEEETYSIQYSLPDYGGLNGLYERIGSRYLVVEPYFEGVEIVKPSGCFDEKDAYIEFCERKEKVPGLCPEWDPLITVDGLSVELSPGEATALSFDETTNESTETFEPEDVPVTVEHKTKYYDDYTRENWYIFNPDSNMHDYSLTTPLLGVGDAVYIPGYGSVNTDQSIDVSADYMVIYDTASGTDGLVDIYTFSKNMTLKEVTLHDGIVEVTGIRGCTLAPESGESYLIYSSTRDGNGTDFDEIYSKFAREIVGNGDTLTQFSVEGEYEAISSYTIGDMVNVNLNISNNGVITETRNLSLTITEPGMWGSENIIYEETKIATTPPKSGKSVMFQYEIPDNSQTGKHRIILEGTTKATAIFMVQAPFSVTFDIPVNVIQAEEFYVNATITNTLDMSLSDITVELDLPNDFATSESLTKNIGTLSSGESGDVSWSATATDFEYGYAPLSIYIESIEGIKDIAKADVNV